MFVGNIPTSQASPDLVREMFSLFGVVKNVTILDGMNDYKSALVSFVNPSDTCIKSYHDKYFFPRSEKATEVRVADQNRNDPHGPRHPHKLFLGCLPVDITKAEINDAFSRSRKKMFFQKKQSKVKVSSFKVITVSSIFYILKSNFIHFLYFFYKLFFNLFLGLENCRTFI